MANGVIIRAFLLTIGSRNSGRLQALTCKARAQSRLHNHNRRHDTGVHVHHPSPPKRTSPRSRRHSSSSPQDLIHLIPCLLPNSGDEAQPALLGKQDNPLGGMLEKAPPTPAAHTHARPMDPRPLRPPLRAPPLRDRRAFLGLNAGVFPFLYFTFLPITNYILYT